MDKIQKQLDDKQKNEASPPKTQEEGNSSRQQKAPKNVIMIPGDETRGLINIHHILSYKEYNATPEEMDDPHGNSICKCTIF